MSIQAMMGIIASSSGGSLYEPETQAIIDRAILEGFYVPGEATLEAIDAFIIDSKDNEGRWSGKDTFYNFTYNDTNCANFSRINWIDPTGDLMSVHGGMSYGINGWNGDGIDGYLDTKRNPYLSPIATDTNVGVTLLLSGDYQLGNINGIRGSTQSSYQFGMNFSTNGFCYMPIMCNQTNAWVGGQIRPQLDIYGTYRDSSNTLYIFRNKNNRTVNNKQVYGTLADYNGNYLINALNNVYNSTIDSYTAGTTGLFNSGTTPTTTELNNFCDYYNTFLIAVGLPAIAT